MKKEMGAPPALLPQVGMRIEQLEGAAIDGSKIQVSFEGQSEPTLLFIFSTRCGVCDLNWPQWESLGHSMQDKPCRLVYANIDLPLSKEYAERYGIEGATLFAQLDPRDEVALNLRLTPDTILIGQSGKIENVWPGLLNEKDVQQILRHLSPMN